MVNCTVQSPVLPINTFFLNHVEEKCLPRSHFALVRANICLGLEDDVATQHIADNVQGMTCHQTDCQQDQARHCLALTRLVWQGLMKGNIQASVRVTAVGMCRVLGRMCRCQLS